MYKIFATTLLLALSSASLNAVSDNEKKLMCHKGKDFYFVMPSVPAHLNHGDSMGSCDNGSTEPGDGDMDGMTAVVVMRCDATEVVSFDASIEFASIQPVEADCADVLAALLEKGFKLRSISSGSASEGDDVQMYTDYVLLGKPPEED